MFDLSAILQQATDVLTGAAEDAPLDMLSDAGIDPAALSDLAGGEAAEMISQIGMEGTVSSALDAASDVLSGR